MAKLLLRLEDIDKQLLELLAKDNKRSLNSEILIAIDAHILKCKIKKEDLK